MKEIEKELLGIKAELMLYAKFLTHDRERANDLMQDTVLKILTKCELFEEGTNFRSWARRIMHNIYIDSLSREGRIFTVEDYCELHRNYSTWNDEACIACETADIYNAVNSLSKEHSEPITFYMNGLKYDEIAVELDIPIGTVKSRIHFSKAELRKALKDYLD